MFLWYDEANDNFVELDTVLDEENSTASVVTEHFSKYLLVDSEAWYNLKFISKCGKYKAVYNKYGDLLTEDNDPINMGTYNYVNYQEDSVAHAIWDVIPYELYGNTSSASAILPSTEENDSDDNAQSYRSEIEELTSLDIEINEKIEIYNSILKKYS